MGPAREGEVWERLGALDQKAGAAHGRLDKVEHLLREDLKEMRREFKETVVELKTMISAHEAELRVVAAEHVARKGWIAGAMFVGGLVGSGLGWLLSRGH